jgi:ribose/xylose/arabinose/galactoside ABC-type transport system permease subunit
MSAIAAVVLTARLNSGLSDRRSLRLDAIAATVIGG